jgi:hypothetical protein
VFTIKTNHAGKQYLSITQESSNGAPQRAKRIVVFQRHVQEFHKVLLKNCQTAGTETQGIRRGENSRDLPQRV